MSIKKLSFVILYGVFALMLILLRLAEVGTAAAWSWWWALAPVWIPASFYAWHLAMTLPGEAISKVWRR